MKKMSWAAVSDAEVARLAKVVPNVNQDETRFLNSVDGLERETKMIIDSKIREYWFESYDNMMVALWLKTSANINSTSLQSVDPFQKKATINSKVNSMDQYYNIMNESYEDNWSYVDDYISEIWGIM